MKLVNDYPKIDVKGSCYELLHRLVFFNIFLFTLLTLDHALLYCLIVPTSFNSVSLPKPNLYPNYSR